MVLTLWNVQAIAETLCFAQAGGQTMRLQPRNQSLISVLFRAPRQPPGR